MYGGKITDRRAGLQRIRFACCVLAMHFCQALDYHGSSANKGLKGNMLLCVVPWGLFETVKGALVPIQSCAWAHALLQTWHNTSQGENDFHTRNVAADRNRYKPFCYTKVMPIQELMETCQVRLSMVSHG